MTDGETAWALQAKIDEIAAWSVRLDPAGTSSSWSAAVRFGYRAAQSEVQRMLASADVSLADVAGPAYRQHQPDRR